MNNSGIHTADVLALGPDSSCLSFDFSCSGAPSSGHSAHPREPTVRFISISNHDGESAAAEL